MDRLKQLMKKVEEIVKIANVDTLGNIVLPKKLVDELIKAYVAQPKKNEARAVLVTTEFRGVFFGYSTKTDGDNIHLSRARSCLYWSADCKGFLGLAVMGPTDECRIGPPADLDIRGVTSVAEVTPEAILRWEAAPWG